MSAAFNVTVTHDIFRMLFLSLWHELTKAQTQQAYQLWWCMLNHLCHFAGFSHKD